MRLTRRAWDPTTTAACQPIAGTNMVEKVGTVLNLILPPVLEIRIRLADVGAMICLSAISSSARSLSAGRVIRSGNTHRNDKRSRVSCVQGSGGQHQVIVGFEGLMLEATEQYSREDDQVG
jgi:hypothetical protein